MFIQSSLVAGLAGRWDFRPYRTARGGRIAHHLPLREVDDGVLGASREDDHRDGFGQVRECLDGAEPVHATFGVGPERSCPRLKLVVASHLGVRAVIVVVRQIRSLTQDSIARHILNASSR